MKGIKDYSLVIFVVLLIGASFFLGRFTGSPAYTHSRPPASVLEGDINAPVSFAPFWRAWNELDQKFVPAGTSTTPISNEEKLWGAIAGLTAAFGDPYTVFLPPEESAMFESDISGNFEGVGMEIGVRDGFLTVISPLKGTPAEKAGIRAGDAVAEINGRASLTITVDEAIKNIRGPKGSSVELTLLREGVDEPIRVTVVRDVINIPTIETEEIAGGIFVLRLYNFSAISPNLFREALRDFSRSRSNKLILDLRGNPGGYLEASIDMASWFLPAGKIIVREDFGGNEEEFAYRSKGYDIFGPRLKMVVLVDGGSASASEILAGALQEHGVATVVGSQTFGKGSVQELIKLTPQTSLKITIARWLTPNGVSISDGGLTPDIVVDLSQEDFEAGRDPQFDKAVEVLRGM